MIKKIITLIVMMLLLSWTAFGTNHTATNATAVYKCDDSLDNDGDGLTDYDGNGNSTKKDPGCFGPADDDESGGATPPPATVQNQTNASSGGGSSFPWGMTIALAVPALFLIAGLASTNEEAASLGQDKLKGVAQNKIISAAGPGAPEILQAATFYQNPVATAQGLAIQEVQKKVLEELAKAKPEVGFMLQIYNQMDGAVKDGQVLFSKGDNKGVGMSNVKVYSDGKITFENLDLKKVDGKADADVSNLVLGKDQRSKVKITASGFKASKPKDTITFEATDDTQNLQLGKYGYTGMKKGSKINVDENGEITEADITTGDKGGKFVLGDKRYDLPKGANIKYNKATGESTITNLGEGSAEILLPQDDGSFKDDDVSKMMTLEGDGRIIVKEGTISGDGSNVKVHYHESKGTKPEYVKLSKTSRTTNGKTEDVNYLVEFEEEGRGLIVRRGVAEKENLRFDIRDDKNAVLLVDTDFDTKAGSALADYQGSWLKKTDSDLQVASSENGAVNFNVLDDDPLFKIKKNDKLAFNINDGAKLQAKNEPKFSIPGVIAIQKKGSVRIVNGEFKNENGGLTNSYVDITSDGKVLYSSKKSDIGQNAVPMYLRYKDLEESPVVITADGLITHVKSNKDIDKVLARYEKRQQIFKGIEEAKTNFANQQAELDKAIAAVDWSVVSQPIEPVVSTITPIFPSSKFSGNYKILNEGMLEETGNSPVIVPSGVLNPKIKKGYIKLLRSDKLQQNQAAELAFITDKDGKFLTGMNSLVLKDHPELKDHLYFVAKEFDWQPHTYQVIRIEGGTFAEAKETIFTQEEVLEELNSKETVFTPAEVEAGLQAQISVPMQSEEL